jgi:hypothetical protein
MMARPAPHLEGVIGPEEIDYGGLMDDGQPSDLS